MEQNLAKCDRCRNEIADLEEECEMLESSGSNNVERMVIASRISNRRRQIARKLKFVDREEEFRRDLAAFDSLEEYLKTKIHGCQVYVHFQHDGNTLPVDLDELKRSRVRPIQVFEYGKDPITNR